MKCNASQPNGSSGAAIGGKPCGLPVFLERPADPNHTIALWRGCGKADRIPIAQLLCGVVVERQVARSMICICILSDAFVAATGGTHSLTY